MSDTLLAAIIGGFAGSTVTAFFGFIAVLFQRRAEERRQVRELAVKVALENWKFYEKASDNLGGSTQPIDLFLIHAVQLVSALDGRLKTSEQIREHLRKGFEASDAAGIEIDALNKRIREEKKKSSAL